MYILIVTIFILGYAAIVFEHPLKLNKTAPALLTGVLCWTVYILGTPEPDFFKSPEFLSHTKDMIGGFTSPELYTHFVSSELAHHLADIAQILFFLLGAMTIVELIDAHQGFKVITSRIKTKDTRKLLWILSLLTFFLSSLLDNLTTAIVMVSLLRKLVHDQEQKKFFAGIIIIASNAGGAWSPIGDVTTTMLWIGGQITTVNIMTQIFLPSMVCLLIPMIFLTFKLKGKIEENPDLKDEYVDGNTVTGSKRMLITGIGALIFVPIFKTVTHLPPYMGMLLGLGIVWVVSEIIHSDKDDEEKRPFTAVHALSKIDTSSVLFFFGILVAIAALESTHLLSSLAEWMSNSIGNLDLIVFVIGLASAVIDNVPLVAASMGMYDLTAFPTDSKLWLFLAYCAGTGGSILIIGSAAGVAVMGMEKIDFMWYVKRISLLAFMGYAAGAATYIGIYYLMN